MKFTVQQIADILEGTIEGDPTVEVSTLSKIEEGTNESLTFLSNPKYTPYLYTTNAAAVIVNDGLVLEKEVKATLIRVKDAQKAFSTLLSYYNQIKLNKKGIETPSFISETAKLGSDVYVGAFVYIGENVTLGDQVKLFPHTYVGDNCKIGNNTIVFSGVKMYADTVIGENCKIHSNVVIGSDGFGFLPDENGVYQEVPQIGNVVIEDNVDIGAATTIDRATLGSTIIKKGVKLDNQVQVAHNVVIDKNTVIAAQAGIAGSTKIGASCMIGGQAGLAGHLTIGNGVKIQAQSGVGKNIKDNEAAQGSPAFDYGKWSKSYVHFKQLGKTVETIKSLEKEVEALKQYCYEQESKNN